MKPFWQICFDTILKKYDKNLIKSLTNKDYISLKKVFISMGGSWAALADGGIDQWTLLKKVCLSFYKVKKC